MLLLDRLYALRGRLTRKVEHTRGPERLRLNQQVRKVEKAMDRLTHFLDGPPDMQAVAEAEALLQENDASTPAKSKIYTPSPPEIVREIERIELEKTELHRRIEHARTEADKRVLNQQVAELNEQLLALSKPSGEHPLYPGMREGADSSPIKSTELSSGTVDIEDALAAIDRRVHDATKRFEELLIEPRIDFQKWLADQAAGTARESFEANRRLAAVIQQTADRLGVVLLCPSPACGKPARLRFTQSGRSKPGFFQFDHGKNVKHGGVNKLPKIKIKPANLWEAPRNEK